MLSFTTNIQSTVSLNLMVCVNLGQLKLNERFTLKKINRHASKRPIVFSKTLDSIDYILIGTTKFLQIWRSGEKQKKLATKFDCIK